MDGFAGAIGVSDSDGKSSPVYSVCTARVALDTRYYAALLRHLALTGFIASLAKGIRERSTDFRFADFSELELPVPPLAQQRAIADFLDRKSAAIDALIAKKERLIELLGERRQALITQMVTKGLDPSVPMKESGIEWLGSIPSHWVLRRLKHLGQIRSGIAKGRDVAGKATVVRPYLRVANVQNGWLDLEDIATIEVTRDEAQRYALRRGDVLMNEGGDFDKLGRGYVWEEQIPDCIHQNHVFAVRPLRGSNPFWINLATQASYLRHFFILRSKQSTNLASISATNLGEAPIPMPPEHEVEAILERVRHQLRRLEHLLRTVAVHVGRLREYRQALITAAVTGQIDVTERGGVMAKTKELHFEDAIEAPPARRTAAGPRATPSDFDRELALVPKDFFAFVEATQPELWAELRKQHQAGLEAARPRHARQGARHAGHARRAAPRLQVLRQADRARLLPARPRHEPRHRWRQYAAEPPHRHAPGASSTPTSENSIDLVLSPQRPPRRHRRAEEPADRPDRRATPSAQYQTDRDPRHALFRFKTARARALRRRPRRRRT